MSVDYKKIGRKIEMTIKDRDITVKEISGILNIEATDIIDLKNEIAQITLREFIDLCDILNISIYEIFNPEINDFKPFMDKKLYELIISCSLKKQQLIYNMVELIVNTKFA